MQEKIISKISDTLLMTDGAVLILTDPHSEKWKVSLKMAMSELLL